MDRSTEIELLEELAGLREARAFYLDDSVAASPVARYTCPDRFARERDALFRRLPAIVAHASELSEPDAFLTRRFLRTAAAARPRRRGCGARLPQRLPPSRHPAGRGGERLPQTLRLPLSRLDLRQSRRAGDRHAWRSRVSRHRQGCARPEAAGLRRGSWLDLDRRRHRRSARYRRFSRRAGRGLRLARCRQPEDRARGYRRAGGELEDRRRGRHRSLPFPHRPQGLGRPLLPGQPVELPGVRPAHPFGPAAHPLRRHDREAEGKLVAAAAPPTWSTPSSRRPSSWCRRTMSFGSRPSRSRPIGRSSGSPPWRRRTPRPPRIGGRTTTSPSAPSREDFAIGESIQGGLSSGANEDLRFGRFEGALDRFNRTVEREIGAGG